MTPATDTPPEEIVALSSEECVSLLQTLDMGRLAVAIGEGVPVIRPVNYAFDPHSRSVVFRVGAGSTLYALIRAAKATFEIDEILSLIHI